MALDRYKIHSGSTFPTGKVKIEIETAYDSQERMAPAKVTLSVNGKQIGQGRIESSVPAVHSAFETFDTGVDLGSGVSLDYYYRAPFEFAGTVNKFNIKYLDQPSAIEY